MSGPSLSQNSGRMDTFSEYGTRVHLVLRVLSGYLVGLFMGVPLGVQFLLYLMALDVLTGLLAAVVSGEGLSSRASYRGMLKKAGMLLALLVLWLLERGLEAQAVPVPASLVDTLAGFWLITEAISSLENLHALGVPLPRVVLRALRSGRRSLTRILEPEPESTPTREKGAPPWNGTEGKG